MEKISARQLGVLTIFLSRSLFLLFIFSYLVKEVKNDIFLVIFLGTLLGMIPILIYQHIQNKMTQNIWETLDLIYPKIISKILQGAILLSILIFSSFLLKHITSYIHYSMSPNISIFIVTITFVLLCYILAQKGIETICRSSEIFFFILILFIVITLLGVFPVIEVQEVKPFFLTKAPSIIKNSILYAFFSSSPIALLLNIPSTQIVNQKNYKRHLLQGYLFSNTIIFLFAFLSITILGIHLTEIYRYPFTIILKKVTFFKIIERLESVLSIHWMFDFVLIIGILFLWLKDGCKNIWKTKKEKKLKGIFLFLTMLSGIISLYIPLSFSAILLCLFLLAIMIPFLLLIKQRKGAK